MTSEGRKALLFFGGTAVALAALGLAVGRVLSFAAGPEAEIRAALEAGGTSGLRVEVPGEAEPAVSSRHAWERVVVDVAPDGEAAVVSATLDFDGRWGAVRVSSLGLEKVLFQRTPQGWAASAGAAPRLSRVLGLLARRQSALLAGDEAALRALSAEEGREPELGRVLGLAGREYRALAWYIRSERDEVVVTEDYHLLGHTPDRAVDEEGSRRLILRRTNGEFLFSPGLM